MQANFVPAQLNDLAVDVALTAPARGHILYRGASKWQNLAPGSAGTMLTSGGAGADPTWVMGTPAADLLNTTDVTKGLALLNYRATNPAGTAFATNSVSRTLRDKLREIPIAVEDFGAVGDGSTDDWAAIQNGINDCLASTTPGRFVLKFGLGKTYTISKPLIIARKNAGNTDFDFCTITLETETTLGYPSLPVLQPTIRITDPLLPAIIIQSGRSVVIRGLILHGLNSPNYVNSDNLLTTTWVSSGVANGRWNPHAGIAIDPFNATFQGTGSAYPGLDSWYIGAGGGSSRTVIEDCFITNFAVGAVFSLGYLSQGDDYQVRDCYTNWCDVAWAPAGTQTRGGSFWNVSAGYCRYFINNAIYGQTIGEMPNVFGGQVSQMGFLFACDHLDWGGFNCVGLYCEDTKGIGSFQGGLTAVNFTGCQFNFTGSHPTVEYTLLSDGPVQFNGCSLGGSNTPLNFAATAGLVSFNGCRLFHQGTFADRAPIVNHKERFRFNDCQLSGSGSADGFSHNWVAAAATEIERAKALPGQLIQVLEESAIYRVRPQQLINSQGLGIPTPDGSGGATVPLIDSSFLSWLQVGDVMVPRAGSFTQVPNGYGANVSVANGYYGRIASINTGTATLTLDRVIKGAGTGFYLAVAYQPLFHSYTKGDVTQGSATISNVTNPGAWAVGDRVRARDASGRELITAPLYITAIAGSTFTLSGGVYVAGTATGAVLFDAEWEELSALDRVGGGFHVHGVPQAAASVIIQGTAGSTAYSYWVVSVDRYGNRTPAAGPFTTATGNATLDATNYNLIQFPTVPGAVAYDLLKTNTSTLLQRYTQSYAPGSYVQAHDTGQATSAYTAPLQDETALLRVDGRLYAGGALVTARNTAPADASLVNGDLSIWFDPTPASTAVMFRAKDTNGTVKTATVALT